MAKCSAKRHAEQREHRHSHLMCLNLVAEVFWRPSDHKSRNKHSDYGKQQNSEQSVSGPAHDHLGPVDEADMPSARRARHA